MPSRRQPQRRRVAALVAAGFVLAVMLPAAAQAHSFLIRSTPEAGARLARSPQTLTLYFSEPFVRSSERIRIRRLGAGTPTLSAPTSSGAVVRQALPPRLRGIFVVSWRVLSDDGHISLGEFAFAVGAGGALPALDASTAGTPWAEVVASWLIFFGIASALGGIASERFVWKTTDTLLRAPAAAGLVLATLGALDQLLLVAGDRRGGGFGSGLSASAIGDAIATRPGRLTFALLIALGMAGALVLVRRSRLAALLPLVAAVVSIAVRGHSGTSGRTWAVIADAIHLVGASLWIGALAHLTLIAARSPDAGPMLVDGARRYSRFALPTVVVILVTGVVTAIAEFRSLGDLIGTSYGQTLLIKAGLVGLALLVALTARRRALPADPQPRFLLLRRLTAGEATALAVVLGAVAVLVNAAPPRTSAAAAALPLLGPPPLAGHVVRVADLAGQLVVGLAASENELQFTIVPPSAQPQESVHLSAEALAPGGGSTDLYPRACGRECFTIRYHLRHGTTRIEAKLGSSVWTGGEAHFSVSVPLPAEQPQLLRRVVETTRRLRSLQLTETVTSGPGSGTQPTGFTLSGRAFLATELFGSGAVDVVPIAQIGGLTELSFALPSSNIWYRLWIDRRYRIRREQILSPGHLIRRSFSY